MWGGPYRGHPDGPEEIKIVTEVLTIDVMFCFINMRFSTQCLVIAVSVVYGYLRYEPFGEMDNGHPPDHRRRTCNAFQVPVVWAVRASVLV